MRFYTYSQADTITAGATKYTLAIKPSSDRIFYSDSVEISLAPSSSPVASRHARIQLYQFSTNPTASTASAFALDPSDPASLMTVYHTITVNPSTFGTEIVRTYFPPTALGGPFYFEAPFVWRSASYGLTVVIQNNSSENIETITTLKWGEG